ncbi:PAS domain-containing protein [Halovenus salina]|uniref:PAS domain S-box protein n=1 Tax=Halovenus salina TaxID=1510225 RepID=A0ABD5W0N7_9EURY
MTRETADGTREFLLQTARYEDDSRGFGIYADITDRVEQRQLLEGYETVLEAVDELVYILDENGRFQFVNKAQESMTGYSRDELLGEHISVLMDEASRQKAREYIDQLQTTDEQSVRFERTATTADGTEIHCEDRMALLPGDSDFQGTAGIIRDITEHKEREQKLQAERERFRVLFERLPEPTLEFKFDDGAPVVKDANPAFEETFGYEAGEIVGESFDEYIVPAGRTEEATTLNQRVREGKQFHSREITRQTADGTREFLFRPAVYSDGDEAFAVYADITEQKDRERQLREEQALTETLINTLPVVFFAFDEQGQFMRWNDRANEISGFSDEEIASMHPAEFVVEEDRPTVYQKMSEIIEHDTTVSFEAKAQNKDQSITSKSSLPCPVAAE